MAKKITGEDGKIYVEKKPFYKRWWFITLLLLVFVGGCSSLLNPDSNETESTNNTSQTDKQKPANEQKANSTEQPKQEVPKEYTSALKKAESYADMMSMSKMGIYDQLTSSAGEGFTPEAAQYAVDNLKWDWNANALKKAESYQEMMAMSPAAIYDQLTSQAGEQFTAEEAQYAIDHLSK